MSVYYFTKAIDQTIDIGKILEKKTGKKLPGFVLRLVKSFIHQDYINGYLSKPGEGKRFFLDILDYMHLKVNVRGWENLSIAPVGTRFTFASNHPLGGVDAIALQGLLWGHFDSAPGILANDFLMNIPAVAELGVGINKTARNLIIHFLKKHFNDKDGIWNACVQLGLVSGC
ncbi:MAG: hypothetical protein K5984_04960 [Bacteroidales bacterium]|nr:hypothetical protein [Bacteroidales bacterium]